MKLRETRSDKTAMNRKTPSQALIASFRNNRFGFLFVSLLLTIGGATILAELGFIWLNKLLIMLNLLILLSITTSRWKAPHDKPNPINRLLHSHIHNAGG